MTDLYPQAVPVDSTNSRQHRSQLANAVNALNQKVVQANGVLTQTIGDLSETVGGTYSPTSTVATALDTLTVSVGAAQTAATDAQDSIGGTFSPTATVASAIATLTTSVASAATSASVTTEQSARIAADDTLTSTIGGAYSPSDTIASALSTLTTSVAAAATTASVTTEQTARIAADNSIIAHWGVNIDVNGHVTGYVHLDGTSSSSEFSVAADKFTVYNGSTTVPAFQITGGVAYLNVPLVAGSVTASKISVGSADNLIVDGNCKDVGYWSTLGGASTGLTSFATTGWGSSHIIYATIGTGSDSYIGNGPLVQIMGGDWYLFSGNYGVDTFGGHTAALNGQWFDASGTSISSFVIGSATSGANPHSGSSAQQAPSNACFALLYVSAQNGCSGLMYLGAPSIRFMANTPTIVDNAVSDTPSDTTGTVTVPYNTDPTLATGSYGVLGSVTVTVGTDNSPVVLNMTNTTFSGSAGTDGLDVTISGGVYVDGSSAGFALPTPAINGTSSSYAGGTVTYWDTSQLAGTHTYELRAAWFFTDGTANSGTSLQSNGFTTTALSFKK